MPNKTDRQASSLAAGITERLDDLGMSRRELSRRAGLSRQTIHNIEKEGNTNLKPSTFQALDAALRWQPGTSLSLALGQAGPSKVEERVNEYLCRIALHLSHMSTAQLELTLIMLEENQLGKANQTTEQFTQAVGELVRGLLDQITALREANHQNAS